MNLLFKIISVLAFFISAYLLWQHSHFRGLVLDTIKGDAETVSEVAIEGFEKIRKRSMDEMKDNQKKKIEERSTDIQSANCPYIGKQDAPITIVEFLDFRCGHCRSISGQLSEFVAENPDVRVNLHFLPILGDESAKIAMFALLANKHGQFSNFYKKMMNAVFPDEMAAASILESLKIKVDSEETKQELENLKDAVIKDTELAQELDVSATPSFIIGNEVILGAQISEIQKAVEKIRQQKKQ